MVKTRQVSKSIHDVSWFRLVQYIKYKGSENQTTVVQIDQYEPTSKTCSRCYSIKDNLELKDRIYECPECGLVIDRDINAALNILRVSRTGLGKNTPEPVIKRSR